MKIDTNFSGRPHTFWRYLVAGLLVIVLAADAIAETLRGVVVGVADGDTITVLVSGNVQHKVRLAEIDAPESKQPYGSRAKQVLSELVYRRTIRVERMGLDRYGRVLGRVFVGDLDVNRELVTEGAAWAYRQYLTDKSLLQVEADAKAAERGLWGLSESQPIPPQKWRRGVRNRRSPVSQTMGSCGDKQYCNQMTSCIEAKHYYIACGVSTLDGDGDGVPCEAFCGDW